MPSPAPMRRQRRSPALLSAAARSQVPRLPDPGPLSPAPRAPAMPRPHRARRAPPPAPIAPHHLSTAPLPPAPIGLASSASRPSRAVARIASTPLRAAIRIPLCRHRADSALIAPHHDHRAPPPSYTCCASPSASRPPCADIRVTLSRCVGPGALAGKNRAVCIPFSPNALKRPSSWQHPLEMHAFRDQDGNILAPCIHFRAQSGDSGCMARESCRQGPFFRVEEPEITHGAKMLPAPPGLSAAAACGPAERALRHATAACGTRHGRTGFAPCGAGLACLPHAPPPCHLARVHRRCLTRAALRRPRPATRSPHRCISPPARRTHPASRADPPRPGNKRNNANSSMRAKNRIPKWGPY